MRTISIRENPDYITQAIKYFQKSWPKINPIIYSDCIENSITSNNPLPQWYLLEKDEEIIGCAGLITNDFISRMDLYPWICALFIEEKFRGNNYGALLINKAKEDAKRSGFEFSYLAQGHHPWGESSRIYQIKN